MKRTLENLTKAFVGESQARNRYTFYAKIAKKEGYEQISEIFLLTAEQEKVHAKRLFEHIQELKKELGIKENSIVIETEAPNVYSNTIENLKASIEGEKYEYEEMYPEFEKVAKDEGLTKIANRFKFIATAEVHHAERYAEVLQELQENTVFKKEEEVWWTCRECGYIHKGKSAPEKCPSCDHPKAYYQVRTDKKI